MSKYANENLRNRRDNYTSIDYNVVKNNLSSLTNDWEDRVKSISQILGYSEYIKEEKQRENFMNQLFKMRTELLLQLDDRRSSVVREICGAISKLSISYGPLFEPLAELILPKLIKLLTNAKEIFYNSADQCIKTFISQHSSNIKLFEEVEKNINNLSDAIRNYIYDYLLAYFNLYQSQNEIEILENNFYAIIQKGIGDASEQVRNTSKKLFLHYEQLFPDKSQDLFTSLLSSQKTSINNYRKNYTVSSSLPLPSFSDIENDFAPKKSKQTPQRLSLRHPSSSSSSSNEPSSASRNSIANPQKNSSKSVITARPSFQANKSKTASLSSSSSSIDISFDSQQQQPQRKFPISTSFSDFLKAKSMESNALSSNNNANDTPSAPLLFSINRKLSSSSSSFPTPSPSSSSSSSFPSSSSSTGPTFPSLLSDKSLSKPSSSSSSSSLSSSLPSSSMKGNNNKGGSAFKPMLTSFSSSSSSTSSTPSSSSSSSLFKPTSGNYSANQSPRRFSYSSNIGSAANLSSISSLLNSSQKNQPRDHLSRLSISSPKTNLIGDFSSVSSSPLFGDNPHRYSLSAKPSSSSSNDMLVFTPKTPKSKGGNGSTSSSSSSLSSLSFTPSKSPFQSPKTSTLVFTSSKKPENPYLSRSSISIEPIQNFDDYQRRLSLIEEQFGQRQSISSSSLSPRSSLSSISPRSLSSSSPLLPSSSSVIYSSSPSSFSSLLSSPSKQPIKPSPKSSSTSSSSFPLANPSAKPTNEKKADDKKNKNDDHFLLPLSSSSSSPSLFPSSPLFVRSTEVENIPIIITNNNQEEEEEEEEVEMISTPLKPQRREERREGKSSPLPSSPSNNSSMMFITERSFTPRSTSRLSIDRSNFTPPSPFNDHPFDQSFDNSLPTSDPSSLPSSDENTSANQPDKQVEKADEKRELSLNIMKISSSTSTSSSSSISKFTKMTSTSTSSSKEEIKLPILNLIPLNSSGDLLIKSNITNIVIYLRSITNTLNDQSNEGELSIEQYQRKGIIECFNHLRLTWAELVLRGEKVYMQDLLSPLFFYCYYLYYSNDNSLTYSILQSFLTMFSCHFDKFENFFRGSEGGEQQMNFFDFNNSNNEFSIFDIEKYHLFAKLNVFGVMLLHALNDHFAVVLSFSRFLNLFCEKYSVEMLITNTLRLSSLLSLSPQSDHEKEKLSSLSQSICKVLLFAQSKLNSNTPPADDHLLHHIIFSLCQADNLSFLDRDLLLPFVSFYSQFISSDKWESLRNDYNNNNNNNDNDNNADDHFFDLFLSSRQE